MENVRDHLRARGLIEGDDDGGRGCEAGNDGREGDGVEGRDLLERCMVEAEKGEERDEPEVEVCGTDCKKELQWAEDCS